MKLGRKSLSSILFWFLELFIAISGQVDIYVAWHITIVVLFVMAFIVYKKRKAKTLAVPVLFLLMLSLFVFSVIISPDQNALIYNIRSSAYSLCAIGILYQVTKYDGTIVCKKIFENIIFFNVLLAVNLLVLSLQIRRNGFLIKETWLAINPYYEDHCAGLFGFNATNVLGLFSIFVMMLNLSFGHTYPKHKKSIIIYTLVMQAIMAFLSQYNDNTGFYMLLIIFMSVYAYTTIIRNKNMSKRIIRFVKYVVLIIVLFFVALNIPVLGEYIRKTVFDKIQRVLFYDSFGGASGGSERLAIIRYAFLQKSTMGFGTGIGATQWIQANSFGFAHFGINSMGSYILIGGLWFYIAYTLLYSEIYCSLFFTDIKKKNYTMKVIILLIVVIFTLYTTIYNDARTALIIGLIATVIKPLLARSSVELGQYYKVENTQVM